LLISLEKRLSSYDTLTPSLENWKMVIKAFAVSFSFSALFFNNSTHSASSFGFSNHGFCWQMPILIISTTIIVHLFSNRVPLVFYLRTEQESGGSIYFLLPGLKTIMKEMKLLLETLLWPYYLDFSWGNRL
jgi:hypothetical protein